MKLRASPSDADVVALDKFACAEGLESRFAAIQRASRLLADANLEDAHELRGLDPATFRYSILRVFDPATPTRVIDEAESHFNQALDTRKHGLNRN